MPIDAIFYEVQGFLEGEAIIARAEIAGIDKGIELSRRRVDRWLAGESIDVECEQLEINQLRGSKEAVEKRLAMVSDLHSRYCSALGSVATVISTVGVGRQNDGQP